MGIKDMFKGKDNLTKELKMLPRDTKKRILENVSRRRNEILEGQVLDRQLKSLNKNQEKEKRTFSKFREGMQSRREELKEKGIIQPPIRYNKQNFRSPLEEQSRKARADEIKRLENQRDKLKSGCEIGKPQHIKMKELKLKVPETSGILYNKKKMGKIKHGFI